MIVDAVVAAVMIISMVIAFFRGFIRESLTIMGVAGGLISAYLLGPVVKPAFKSMLGGVGGGEKFFGIVPRDLMFDVLAYGSVFLVVVIGLSLISHAISKLAREAGLGIVDRSLGVVFGIIRGVLILGLIYTPIYLIFDKEALNNWTEDAYSKFYLDKTAVWIISIMPHDMRSGVIDEHAQERVQEIGNTAREKLKNMEFLPESDPAAPNGNTDIPAQEPAPDEGTAPDTGEQGYQNEDRENLEQLFREGSYE